MTRAELNRWFIAEVLPHEAALMRYLRRICRDVCDVRDTLHEVYIKVCMHVPEQPKSYMFEAARNFVTDQIRRTYVARVEYRNVDAAELQDIISPERVILAGEEAERLMGALKSLSDDRRAVVWMRRVQGLSQRDTAKCLGMKEGTVESHVVRGVRSLAKAMA